MARILVVDDEKSIRETIKAFLKDEGHDVQVAEDAITAVEVLKKDDFDVVVTDIILPKMSGVKLLRAIRHVSPHVQVIMITGEPTIETASDALRLGAFDYLSKPVTKEAIVKIVANAACTKALTDEKLRLEKENLNYQMNLERLVEERTSELMKSEEKFRSYVENAPDGIFVTNNKGNYLDVNQAACDLLGYTRKELLKLSISDIVTPGSLEEALNSFYLLVENGRVHGEYLFTHADGHEFHMSVDSTEISPDKFIGFCSDISDRKRAEEALLESEAKFRSVIEQSNDAIHVLYKGKFDLINTRFSEMFGVSFEDVISPEFNFIDLIAPESKSKMIEQEEMRKRGEKPPPHYEFVAFDKDHNLIEVEASGTEISYRGGEAFLCTIRDVTERKRLEEQFHQAQKMESVGRLAGGVAHDFNNLLTVITGHAELAAMQLDSHDPFRDDIKGIQEAANRAADLTRQLLAFSRKQKLQPRLLNLNVIITQLNKMLQRMIGEDIEILTLPDNDLWNLKIDPGQIEQVIINLVVNARDAMPAGGKLTISTRNTVLDKDNCDIQGDIPAGNYILLTVTDTGEGMSDTVKKQIFEPFFTTKAEGKGTGLGLSTVFGIVIQSDGGIEVHSELGEGTTFSIFLPQAEEDIEEIVFEGDAIDLPRGTETILIAEDDDALRSLVCRILRGQGYKTIEAQNGGEALMICRELDKPVDLVITDVVMPSMRGEILIKNLREIWSEVKVLYMSGYSAEKVSDSKILESDDPFIQKPFRPIDLTWKVRKVLDS